MENMTPSEKKALRATCRESFWRGLLFLSPRKDLMRRFWELEEKFRNEEKRK